MHSKSYRLDRFINKRTAYTKSETRLLIAQGRIRIDGQPAQSIQQKVTQFTQVELDGNCLQNNSAVYIMLNKPKGIVSATTDPHHKTVLDLIDPTLQPSKDALHIAGRLDFNTTGLMLLTNDGDWSKRISLPENKLNKSYIVTTASPISEDYIETFRRGIYFEYEGVMTQPASLEIISDHTAILSLTEGKYHQVKRMFGYFDNQVIDLHRQAIGNLTIEDLPLGQYRTLSTDEIEGIFI